MNIEQNSLKETRFFYFTINTVNEATLGSLPLAVQYQCYLRNTMPRQWSPADTASATGLRERLLPSGVFYQTPLPAFQGFIDTGSLTSKLAGLNAVVRLFV